MPFFHSSSGNFSEPTSFTKANKTQSTTDASSTNSWNPPVKDDEKERKVSKDENGSLKVQGLLLILVGRAKFVVCS
jgi:hypothetical protein